MGQGEAWYGRASARTVRLRPPPLAHDGFFRQPVPSCALAFVAQGIGRPPPEREAAGSNPVEGTRCGGGGDPRIIPSGVNATGAPSLGWRGAGTMVRERCFFLHSRRDDRANARLRTWCNGSTRPSQGRGAGPIPVVRTIPSPGTSTSPAPLSHRGRRSDAGAHPSAVLADRRLVKAPAAFRDPSHSCHARSRQCPPDGLPCAWHRLPVSSQAGGRGGVNPPHFARRPHRLRDIMMSCRPAPGRRHDAHAAGEATAWAGASRHRPAGRPGGGEA